MHDSVRVRMIEGTADFIGDLERSRQGDPVLGSLLVAERAPRLPVALACLLFAGAFDLLFFVTNELPATVPVAAALLASEAWQRHKKRVAPTVHPAWGVPGSSRFSAR